MPPSTFFQRARLHAALAGSQRRRNVGDAVLVGPGDDIGRRALQQRDVGRRFRQLRHERDRGRAAADHDDALVGVDDILGPVLGMDDGALEPGDTWKGRRVALRVAVVAAAHEQEIAGDVGHLLGRAALHLHRPSHLRRRPRRALDAMVEADLAVDAVLARGLAHVVQDGLAVGDGLGPGPRLERVAEREHVGVRAHARIAKQVPRAADAVAGLENGKIPAGALLPQVTGRPDARKTGADNDDVDVVSLHSVLQDDLLRQARASRRLLRHLKSRAGPAVFRRKPTESRPPSALG